MKTNRVRCLALALGCLVLSLPSRGAEPAKASSIDVALKKGGVLVGQVVNTDGQALVGTDVILSSGGREIARCQTGKEGWFQVASLKGGPLEVKAAGTTGICRVWAPDTAPPAAQQGLLVVAGDNVVRAQHCGTPVGCGSAVHGRGVRGHGGGLLALMIDHPLVTAGAVGAAIAVPLAVSDDDSPSTP